MTVQETLNMIREQDMVCLAFADGITGKCMDLNAVLNEEALNEQVDYINVENSMIVINIK